MAADRADHARAADARGRHRPRPRRRALAPPDGAGGAGASSGRPDGLDSSGASAGGARSGPEDEHLAALERLARLHEEGVLTRGGVRCREGGARAAVADRRGA